MCRWKPPRTRTRCIPLALVAGVWDDFVSFPEDLGTVFFVIFPFGLISVAGSLKLGRTRR